MMARSRRWRGLALVAACLAGTVTLAGCSSSDSGGSAEAPQAVVDNQGRDAAAPGPGSGAEPGAGPAAEPPKGQGGQAPTKVEQQQRALIYTCALAVRVDDVPAAADRAGDIAAGAGGVIGGDRRTLNDRYAEAELVLRVPADKFTGVVDQLAKLGEEESRAVSTTDVTEDLVDLDARVAAQEASVQRVRTLLAEAKTLGEVMSIESELTRRTAELDSLKQRRERLSGLVALSTITLTLRGSMGTPPPVEPESGFVSGLKSGWAAFLDSVGIVATVLGWLLPWGVVIGIPVWLLAWAARRRTRQRTRVAVAAPSAPAPPAPAPAAAAAAPSPGAPAAP